MTPSYLNTAEVLFFKDTLSAQKFSTTIVKPFSLKWQKAENSSIIFLDSFDGRLFRAGYTAILTDQKLYIKSIKENYVIDWPKKELPKRAENFTDSKIKKLFGTLLDVRSLTKVLSVKATIKPFFVLNADQKTIARANVIICKSTYPQINKSKTLINIKPLRGYSANVKLLKNTLPPFNSYSDFNSAMVAEFAIDLNDYSKPVYDLLGGKNISQALYEILYKNFLVMRKNEKGIIDDIDMEFLHDYRVACRRMRSALSLLKNVLNPLSNQMLKLDLKHIGKYSGHLRDLDVYLLREDDYKSILPKNWPQKDIHAIFVKLRNQRKRAYNKMVKILKSVEYIELIERWEHLFNDFNHHIQTDSPLLQTTSAMISKWFEKIIKKGKLLSAKTPDDKFHDLRITCKKLRYLLEFFGTLYPEPLVSKAVKQLKKLQENLGEFNDYSVQIDTLNQLLDNSISKPTEFVKTVAGLITVLDYKMHQLRDEFYSLFTEFSSVDNITLYKQLCEAK